MSDDDERQHPTTSDMSRLGATVSDSAYSLSIEEALARYEAAGIPRTRRSVQRNCANGALDAHRVETTFGEKFWITPASVDRHIAYINEVRPVATSHDPSRPDRTGAVVKNADDDASFEAAIGDNIGRRAATTSDVSQRVAVDARVVELLERENLTGAMVKGDLVTFPGVLTGNKNGIEHTFPIGPMTLALFPPLRAGFLFPARGRPDRPFNGWSKSKRALDQAAPIAPWRLHDFRRTLRTKWEELGISPAVSERYLNHVSGVHSGVQGIYNRYKYLPEMRGAVARWEQHLSDLTASSGQSAKGTDAGNS